MSKLKIYLSALSSVTLMTCTAVNAQSLIPYTFKDGEVISADTLNDLFDGIRRILKYFSTGRDLELHHLRPLGAGTHKRYAQHAIRG